jgi:tight adherence protein B
MLLFFVFMQFGVNFLLFWGVEQHVGFLRKVAVIFSVNMRSHWSDIEVPRFLSDLASAVRAGVNLRQGFEHLSEARRWRGVCFDVLNEISIGMSSGRTTAESLMGIQMEAPDPLAQRLLVSLRALATAASSGGDVGKLLENSAEAARAAVRLRLRAKALTAQMRLQALIVSLAPLLVVVVLSVVSPSSLVVFSRDPVGIMLAFAMLCSNLCGVFFLVRLVKAWGK